MGTRCVMNLGDVASGVLLCNMYLSENHVDQYLPCYISVLDDLLFL